MEGERNTCHHRMYARELVQALHQPRHVLGEALDTVLDLLREVGRRDVLQKGERGRGFARHVVYCAPW